MTVHTNSYKCQRAIQSMGDFGLLKHEVIKVLWILSHVVEIIGNRV